MRRLRRAGDFREVQPGDDTVQLLTDCMANGMEVQLEYLNSGWRTVVPYGWYGSKKGDLLVMCLKEGTAVRSYRMDRITQVNVDSSLFPDAREDLMGDYDLPQFEEFEVPEIPEADLNELLLLSENEEGTPTPYDEALEAFDEFEAKDEDFF